MHRYAISDLKDWARRGVPKPLILRGARQVGKSTLVRMLSQELGYDLVEINLEKKTVKEFDNTDDFSIEKVITEIEVLSNTRISENTLLFLDEIQAQPSALKALRYFYEDKPGLKVIAAGSLLEVVIKKSDYSMPVGRVEYYYLGPMTFTEFLLAKGENLLVEEIKKISLHNPSNASLHSRAIDSLKEYYFVGGMPEAVREYAEAKDFKAVRDLHHSLIQTYKDDIPKYAKNLDITNLLAVLDYCAHKLGKKVIFSQVLKGAHSSKIKGAIELLSLANIVYKTCHNTSNGFPFSVGSNPDIFKLFLLDVGIYNCYLELEWSDIYKLPSEQLLTKGNIAEQFVAQHLAFRYPKKELSALYYWLRGGNAAEVDFILSHQSKIYPLEIKSGSSGKLRSLWQFVLEKKIKYALRADLSLRKQAITKISHKVVTGAGVKEMKCELVGFPLYAIENLNGILGELGE